MKIIVDANIVFSAILNTNSRIADIILNSNKTFEFIAPDFLQLEIKKYHSKIAKITKLSIEEIESVESKIFHPISFMSGFHIPEKIWLNAESITKDIDEKDIPYVAFSIFYKCKLWTGDKVLHNGLLKKNFKNIILTNELEELRKTKWEKIKNKAS